MSPALGACVDIQPTISTSCKPICKVFPRWVLATEVAEHRRGQIFIFAIGGAARRVFGGMSTHEKQYSVDLDGAQGQGGFAHVCAIEFILGVV